MSRPFSYPAKGGPLHCDEAALDSLAARFNTPLYVYSAQQIGARFDLFSEAFAGRPHTVCYAVKANSSLAILRLLAARGAGFDIVSGGELERVLAADKTAAGRVVFSGVGKTAAELDLALRTGILLFNVESEAELDLLAERAAKLRRTARISLRVNPDVFAETHPYISTGLREHKFGIDMRTARSAYRAAARTKWLEPAGISVHIGSQIRSAEPFGAAVARAGQMVRALRREGIVLRFVDAGGGLGVEYHAEKSFDPAAAVKRYAQALTASLAASLGPLVSDVHLLLEPGRFLVAQAGALLTRVLFVKKNGRKTFVITDAGMNDLIRPALYQAHHEIVPVAQPKGRRKRIVDVVGPVCESGDFFARDRELPEVKAGELLAILDAGAYGLTLSSNYNSRPRPAEVMVDGRKARLVRRRETMEDLLRPEIE